MEKRPFLLILLHLCFKIYVHATHGPPRLLLEGRGLQKKVFAGAEAHLPCPVAGTKDSLVYDWYKSHQLLPTIGNHRYHVTHTGTLVIQHTAVEDSGFYVCEAFNQKGEVEAHVHLMVLSKFEDLVSSRNSGEDDGTFKPHGTTTDSSTGLTANNRKSSGKLLDPIVDGSGDQAPVLTTSKHEDDNIFQRPVGSSVVFRCAAKGKPKPVITWFKDDKQVLENGLVVRELSNSVRISRWSMMIENLKIADSGKYSCVAYNIHGKENVTFVLQVVDQILSKPELTGSHPVNTTVEYGRTATFQCRVRSQDVPHIQWLRRVKKKETVLQDDLIKVKDEFYHVLKSDHTVEQPKGMFLNKLHINEARESDSGKYLCLGSTPTGYSYRSAFLTVTSPRLSHSVGWTKMSENWNNQTNPLLVALPIVLGVLIGVAVTLVVVCHRRRLASSFQYQKGMESHSLQTQRRIGSEILEVVIETHLGQSVKGKARKIYRNPISSFDSYAPLNQNQQEKLDKNQESVASSVNSEVVFNGGTAESRLWEDAHLPDLNLASDSYVMRYNV
ncbi:fibroblast growth factor receptor-like 1 isoform X2 [Limulus polyphemus]|uniref:Fibroblast growth factor receptor-like 1 isoform X2 n=1 Tax=Limulus polyphemus TaxID=6850 RepID=A0ABM1T7W0_LIMPO|nr:fibroblast growth factor receptor-like 1 isoform X2 [Limulus polyphemus]